MEDMGTIKYKSASINVELLTSCTQEAGRHCETFIAEEYYDGQTRNGE